MSRDHGVAVTSMDQAASAFGVFAAEVTKFTAAERWNGVRRRCAAAMRERGVRTGDGDLGARARGGRVGQCAGRRGGWWGAGTGAGESGRRGGQWWRRRPAAAFGHRSMPRWLFLSRSRVKLGATRIHAHTLETSRRIAVLKKVQKGPRK